MSFRGPSKVTLDAKGRLAIPSRYRERILALCGGQLVTTVDRDRSLLIYPLPDWEEVERKFDRLSSVEPKARGLKRLMQGYATDMEMDDHGRILLPRELREYAGLERQGMLIGQGNKFELWDEQRWNECCEQVLSDDGSGGLPEQLENLSF
jgi:MraZ protein